MTPIEFKRLTAHASRSEGLERAQCRQLVQSRCAYVLVRHRGKVHFSEQRLRLARQLLSLPVVDLAVATSP